MQLPVKRTLKYDTSDDETLDLRANNENLKAQIEHLRLKLEKERRNNSDLIERMREITNTKLRL